MRVYRIIEYEIPENDASAAEWLSRTLARSIDGKYNPAGSECSIVAAPIDQIRHSTLGGLASGESRDMSLADLAAALLDEARTRQWEPPVSKTIY